MLVTAVVTQNVIHIRELAVERGDNLADGLGSTSGRGDDVVANGTATTPVLVRGTIDGLLGSGRGVDGCHQTLSNTELVMDDLGEGRKAVGGARRVRDLPQTFRAGAAESDTSTYDSVLGVVLVQVDTADEHGSISGGRRDDDLLCATLQVGRGPLGRCKYILSPSQAYDVLFGGGENTGGLDDVLGTDRSPGDVGGVLLSED